MVASVSQLNSFLYSANAMSANATIIGEGICGTVMFIPMEGDQIMVDLEMSGLDGQ